MSKNTLTSYDQLLALDLKSEFPGLNSDRLKQVGVRNPTMGEVRLIHAVMGGKLSQMISPLFV